MMDDGAVCIGLSTFFERRGDAVSARFLERFLGNFYFNLQDQAVCGIQKSSGNLNAVFLCYSVRCLYEFLCDFSIFVPHLLPPPHACTHVFFLTILIHISGGQLLITSFRHLKDERNIVNSTIPSYLYFLKLNCLLLLF